MPVCAKAKRPVGAAVSAACALALVAVTGWAAHMYRLNGRGRCSHNGYDMAGISTYTADGWSLTPCADADTGDAQCAPYSGSGSAVNTCHFDADARPPANVSAGAPVFSGAVPPAPVHTRPTLLSRAGDFDLSPCDPDAVLSGRCAFGGSYVADLKGGDPCVVRGAATGDRWHTLVTVACLWGFPAGEPMVVPRGLDTLYTAFAFDTDTCTARTTVLHASGCVDQHDVRSKWVTVMACAAPAALVLLLVTSFLCRDACYRAAVAKADIIAAEPGTGTTGGSGTSGGTGSLSAIALGMAARQAAHHAVAVPPRVQRLNPSGAGAVAGTDAAPAASAPEAAAVTGAASAGSTADAVAVVVVK